MTFSCIDLIGSRMVWVVLTATVVTGVTKEPAAVTPAAPKRLAIYYGYPSLVNDAGGDLDRAARVFGDYDVIVFGDGLELPSAGAEGVRVSRLIGRLTGSSRAPQIYGYVDLGNTQSLPLVELERRINLWKDMGVAGIFFDEAGFDFGVTRDRQNAVVAFVHARGLGAVLNAAEPDDVFGAAAVPLNAVGGGNPMGAAPLIDDRDMFLLESFAVRNGVPENPEALSRRTLAALNGRARRGTRIIAVSTSDAPGDQPSLASYAWWTAAAFGLDAYGWGMPVYSAVTSTLPWIARPDAEGPLGRAAYGGHLTFDRARWSRPTTAGMIVVDTRTHTGALVSLKGGQP